MYTQIFVWVEFLSKNNIIEKIAQIFNVNANTVNRYTEADETVVYVENNATLKIHTDGIVEYKARDEGIQLTDSQKADIKFLQEIEVRLSQPRVLRMLVWQYYFQKPLKSLWTNILGGKEVTGIYKITNQITGEVYIGQAVNVQKRFSEHAKCGLGIDTPAGNKLYAAMKEYGLDAFSWELLEECKSELLNEKERKYIELYDSVNYGYNSQKGNK